jgi:hypothetical protein
MKLRLDRLAAASGAVLITLATVWSVANAAYPAAPQMTLAAKPLSHCTPG